MIKPGRELDLLIAEKVMKVLICKGDFDGCGENIGYEGWYRFKEGPICVECDGTELLNYSTDIAAAWEVLEKLRDLRPRIIITHNFENPWSCSMGNGRDVFIRESSTESAPHAICLAALKAVGEIEK